MTDCPEYGSDNIGENGGDSQVDYIRIKYVCFDCGNTWIYKQFDKPDMSQKDGEEHD